MKKSSLGARRSSAAPVRISKADASTELPERRSRVSEKKSLLPVPKWGNVRAASLERFEPPQLPAPNRRSRSAEQPKSRLNSAVSSNSRTTPHAQNYAFSSGSTQSRKQSTSSRISSIGAQKRKDGRPVTDKNFQMEAAHKVKKYFINRPHLFPCASMLTQGFSHKMMTQKLFVEMCSLLLSQLCGPVNITMGNYLTELPAYFKRLRYPGNVSKSWLISVNTSHSWPNVLAAISWLVDLHECLEAHNWEDVAFPEAFDEVDNTGDVELPPKVKLQHLLQSYRLWNEEGDEADQKLEEEQKADILLRMGLDDASISALEDEVARFEAEAARGEEKSKEQLEVEELVRQRNSYSAKVTSLQDALVEDNYCLKELNAKEEEYSKTIIQNEKQIEQYKQQIQLLKQKLSGQKMTVQQEAEKREQCKNIRENVVAKDEEIADLRKLLDKADTNMANSVAQVRQLCVDMNHCIETAAGTFPELRDVRLEPPPVTPTVDLKAAAEARQLVAERLKAQLKAQVKALDEEKQLLANQHSKEKERLAQVDGHLKKTEKTIEKLKNNIMVFKQDTSKQETELDAKCNKITEEKKKIQEDIRKNVTELEEWQGKLQCLEASVKKLEEHNQWLEEMSAQYFVTREQQFKEHVAEITKQLAEYFKKN